MKSKEQYKREFQLVITKSDDTVVEENILHDFAREVSVIDSFLMGGKVTVKEAKQRIKDCLLYTSPSPRDGTSSRMPSSA